MPKKHSPEVRERALRVALERVNDYPSMNALARKLKEASEANSTDRRNTGLL